MKHIVKYTESERGWGGEVWYIEFPSEKDAKVEEENINLKFAANRTVPDYYVVAEYIGEWATVPIGYKF